MSCRCAHAPLQNIGSPKNRVNEEVLRSARKQAGHSGPQMAGYEAAQRRRDSFLQTAHGAGINCFSSGIYVQRLFWYRIGIEFQGDFPSEVHRRNDWVCAAVGQFESQFGQPHEAFIQITFRSGRIGRLGAGCLGILVGLRAVLTGTGGRGAHYLEVKHPSGTARHVWSDVRKMW